MSGATSTPMLAPQAPRKPLIQPSVPMKPVYWSKVVNPLGLLNPLLWDQLEEVEVPGDQLEELFAKAAPKKVQPKEEKKEEEVQKSTQHEKAKPARVIDPKKGQNLGIFLKSSKLNLQGVEDIIYRLNYAGDLESLVSLRSFQATEEELGMLEHHVSTQADQPLDLPDQFLFDISKLNSIDSRLACLQFKMSFSDKVDEVEVKMVNLRSCCTFLSSEPCHR